jgi:hypothetical protein
MLQGEWFFIDERNGGIDLRACTDIHAINAFDEHKGYLALLGTQPRLVHYVDRDSGRRLACLV